MEVCLLLCAGQALMRLQGEAEGMACGGGALWEGRVRAGREVGLKGQVGGGGEGEAEDHRVVWRKYMKMK